MTLATVLKRSREEKENWRYTDLDKLLKSASSSSEKDVLHFSKAKAAFEGPCLVFIDGVWTKEQSCFGDLPPSILEGNAKDGYRFILEGQTCLVTLPVELLFLTTENKGEVTTKIYVELGKSGRLTLIERHETEAGCDPHILETTIKLHHQAKLVHGKIVNGSSQSIHLAKTTISVAEGAYYDNFTLIKGGKLTRNELDASLIGKLAQCAFNGAMLVRHKEHADTTTRITHAAPHGTSREVYKSVIAGQARGVFQGKILVEQNAQKTDSHQLSRALLLSDQAEMDAKPELEIYADDVKCSHGTTIGDLDDDALFYLRSRGLNESEARALLIEAFVNELIDEIHVTEWRDFCHGEVRKWLDEQT